jgi:hypothetical protein
MKVTPAIVKITAIPQHKQVPHIRCGDHWDPNNMPPEADISDESWSTLSDNHRVAKEKSSACQQSTNGKDNAPTTVFGIEKNCQP